ncbi:sterol desaturase family protein [Plastoroseomonas arctica]|uniref:Sterol desaturase family protein n=1 Tax=Plastoroseomonas arctica TaxID=1509237 RepID=A0AAF1KPX2_9PROT|nr:sterol desaturase family protein [Plastoroseomonas arctica]MBR0656668.1 sterol desaturase family protein [Plastoroseomonas arctica]
MIDGIFSAYGDFIGWLYTAGLQPMLYALGMMDYADDLYRWLDFAVFGLIGIIVSWVVCRPLEAANPVERWENRDPVHTDIIYTVLSRVGVFPLLAFVLLNGAQSWLEGTIANTGFVAPTLESLVPPLRDHPLLALACYVVILDFGEYWRHRFQHRFGWWWALHSVHHAQTQMTFWTDDRNHILDDVLAALWFGALALLIGVPLGQFPVILLILRLAESMSHANIRMSYGSVGERLVVSPRFHRLHHGLLSAGQTGKNYGVLLPVWDWMFGTADFDRRVYPPTGVPDGPEGLATGSWFRQQVLGVRRLAQALTGRG